MQHLDAFACAGCAAALLLALARLAASTTSATFICGVGFTCVLYRTDYSSGRGRKGKRVHFIQVGSSVERQYARRRRVSPFHSIHRTIHHPVTSQRTWEQYLQSSVHPPVLMERSVHCCTSRGSQNIRCTWSVEVASGGVM